MVFKSTIIQSLKYPINDPKMVEWMNDPDLTTLDISVLILKKYVQMGVKYQVEMSHGVYDMSNIKI